MLSCCGLESGCRVGCLPEIDGAEVGLARVRVLADEVTDEAAAAIVLVWRSQRALLVTRQETHLPNFQESCERLVASGWPVIVRKSGGGACPVSPSTVQIATIEPAVAGTTMNAKYEALTKHIQTALQFYGVIARTGAVPGAYCPGSYDLSVQGKKIAGMSQHWFRNRSGIRCVVTTASINVEEGPVVLADVINAFYRNAGCPMRCRADVLDKVRLSVADAVPADFVPAFMQRLVSVAGPDGDRIRHALHQTATSHRPVTEQLI